MGLFIGYTIIYLITGFVGACVTCPRDSTGEDVYVVVFFWPLLFIKWTLKQLFNILFKYWKD